MVRLLNQFISHSLDLLFPKICSRCGEEGHYLCSPRVPPEPITEFFARQARGQYLDGIVAAYSYSDQPVREAIHSLKYNRVHELGAILGSELAHQVGGLLDLQGVVVPVPLHRSRLRERGFNQAVLIAAQLPFPMTEALIRTRATGSQVNLQRSQRRTNMAHAFGPSAAIKQIKNKTVFLVDDVATTGATLNACARVLKRHGAARVFGVVVARD